MLLGHPRCPTCSTLLGHPPVDLGFSGLQKRLSVVDGFATTLVVILRPDVLM